MSEMILNLTKTTGESVQTFFNPDTEEIQRFLYEADNRKELQEKLDKHKTEMEDQGWELEERIEEIGRNDTCPCGSGRKFKKCCLSQIRGQSQVEWKGKNKYTPHQGNQEIRRRNT